jgi:saccharopine dehydrogenase-like NADP-dependent oxidoreductase
MSLIGEKVTFFGLEEDFSHVTNVDTFIRNLTYYEVVYENISMIEVKHHSEDRNIPVITDEYLIFTEESLRAHLKNINNAHAAICTKVRQLYRKHNNSDSLFKFTGV